MGAAATLPPTPACGDDDDDPTPHQTEGPFYTPDSPERRSLLEAGMQGVTMILSGQVLGTDCQPIPGALLDFWHADANGVYDNAGYTLRGHQFADANGRYELETIMPGLYVSRTRHFHVKVQRPNGVILTTQLYFPDEAANLTDGIFDDRLLLTILPAEIGVRGEFNFVLE
jgi:protocatechuate 3,4-dioxygenase beta subunit